jgi:hypothetical protein
LAREALFGGRLCAICQSRDGKHGADCVAGQYFHAAVGLDHADDHGAKLRPGQKANNNNAEIGLRQAISD